MFKARTFYFQDLPKEFSKNLKSYLKILKKNMPNNMEIGLNIHVAYFQDSVDPSMYFKIFKCV